MQYWFAGPSVCIKQQTFSPSAIGYRAAIIEESQPVKNRNLSRLISNLKIGQVNAAVFIVCHRNTLLQQQEVRRTCVPRNLPCLVS